ncbi:MAG: thiamine-phosphate kinase [Deltaproteobacteria bacterium]|nr:MAG: thiamine-phosphate kinase [Deltaproteobacteria bacterium]
MRRGATELEPPQAGAAHRRGIRTEQDVIDALVRVAPRSRPLAVANGDDCVVLPDGTAITVDLLCEGVHFDDRLAPADVGYKAVAVSVSDLASMGAEPQHMVLALSHPAPDDAWLEDFAGGVAEASARWGIDLVGGDTTRGPSIAVSVTAFGKLVGEPLTRAGAVAGDQVFVAGALGLAGAGYRLDDPPEAALRALRRPDPVVGFALDLARRGLASAAMDVSDGLTRDLPRLARASDVAIAIDPGRIPVPEALRDHPAWRSLALGAGDDYALLFTSSAANEVSALAAEHGVTVTAIGEVRAGSGARCTDGPWPTGAWSHFGEDA